ncbi:fungal-specific transcription factor domain-containing protein [Aspergillus germanicus]
MPEKQQTKACLACRKVKMKCMTSEGGSVCDRCSRKSLPCVVREHCRGRKPGMRLTRKEGQRPATTAPSRARVDFFGESDSFQPQSLLSHQAMKGRFSLRNILSVDHGVESRPSLSESLSPDDPVVLGLINTQVASCLLEYFMQKINPYISQLDPALHTFSFLRKSPFLMTTVLAAAAKAFESSLYADLNAHAEALFATCFRRGDKSTEIIQAILLTTYWKEPNDTRVWTSVGLAIRIAMDLGWHKLSPTASRKEGLTEHQRREIRNVERTFLVLFVYDRSLSLQTGKPWMIERNELIDSAEAWWQDSISSPNDQLLCSFVALRLITADTFDILSPSKAPIAQMERLLNILNNRIDAWQTRWLTRVSSSTGNPCHAFLIKFYGNHARLQLFSLPLHETRVQTFEQVPATDIKPFWLSFQNALAMLQLVSESSSLLYLAQDSVHVMVAYAAIFLIKILLFSPLVVTSEIGSTATKAIRDAADTFASLSAPPNSSCTYQARFLEKILLEYTRIRNNRMETPRRRTHPSTFASNPPIQDPASTPAELRLSLGFMLEGEQTQPRQHTSIAPNPELHIDAASDEFASFLGDEGVWDDIFAVAGFNLQEGVFSC